MKLTSSVLILTTACCALFVALPDALAQTPGWALGTWKLNLVKSKGEPWPLPKSLTRTSEDRGDGVSVLALRGLDAVGRPTFFHFVWRLDGQEYPYGSGVQTTISGKLVDANTVEFVIKSAGKTTTTGTEVISRDGKTLTRKADSTDGTKIVYVYDRQ